MSCSSRRFFILFSQEFSPGERAMLLPLFSSDRLQWWLEFLYFCSVYEHCLHLASREINFLLFAIVSNVCFLFQGSEEHVRWFLCATEESFRLRAALHERPVPNMTTRSFVEARYGTARSKLFFYARKLLQTREE